MKIIFTGGGTLGPVTPLLAVIEELKKLNPDVQPVWVGTRKGVERRFLSEKGIVYRWILAGKLRRYFDLRNCIMPFSMLAGFFASLFLLLTIRPKAVIGAGGFVQVPLMYAAKLCNVPVFIHQQDIEAGLANRLSARVAAVITVAFPEAEKQFNKKVITVGNPCRRLIADLADPEARRFAKERGLKRWNFFGNKPIIFFLGGGTGGTGLNEKVIKNIDELLVRADIIHLTGRGKSVVVSSRQNYVALEFLDDEIAEAYAVADLVVCRAGLGTITELGTLGLPAVLVPFAGHQEKNAAYFASKQAALALAPDVSDAIFKDTILRLLADRDRQRVLSGNISDLFPPDAAAKLAKMILEKIK
jgi:UDP-N-acetylglucosamine--N-acetylmuramyl-(pentapeptide) pyrophosphoryl-undecaprenol N-acetylglucosamine transferase